MMKQKIKIMEHKPHLSDEEIRSYMNFDRLLDERKVALSSTKNLTAIKWIMGVSVITATAVWFFLMMNNENHISQKAKKQVDSVQNFQRTPLVDKIDSENETVYLKHAGPDPDINSTADAKILKPDGKEQVTQKKSETSVTESGYVQAEPAQGYSVLYNFFSTNLKYPPEGLKDSIQGVQTISFVINTMGKPEDITIVNSLGKSFDEESTRLVENMPDWKPAMLDGKPVASKISLPITFQIQKIKN